MRLRVLGPVEVSTDAGPVYLVRRQQRLILGILAIEANRVVSVDRLIDLLWGNHPPRQARAVIQTRVSGLRATLAGHLDGPQGLLTRGNGYLLAIEPELVDVHEFRMLVERASGSGTPEQARKLLRSALDLWHGPVLGGWLPADSHAVLCDGIEALRLTAAEDLFEVELRLGDRHFAVNELIELAAANPARERLTALAMTALHRVGRTAEALQLFDRCRRWLAEELGVDPGVELQDLHLAMLRGDADPADRGTDAGHRLGVGDGARPGPREQPVTHGFGPAHPRLLPVDIPDFTGRTDEMARLRDVLTGAGGGMRLAVVSGPGGVGKTALSVHVAHQLQDQFTHGQLYVDLHGFDRPDTLSPNDVLARFLRALGVESTLPTTLDERAELYRGLVAGRNILVVLDNARDPDQVRPLIPGSSTCAVVITSRTRLAAAVGGSAIDLDILTEPQAIDLISRVAGRERIRSEPLAAAGVVALCGGLPLAVRIAAAQLVAKPHWSVERLVDRLTDERQRLDRLSYGDLDVRASIELSYASMNADARLLLCRLGDIDLPEVNVWTSAALLDLHPVDAEEVLEKLHDAQLVEVAGREAGGYSRYRLHDLVRLFAKERAASDDVPSALEAARRRAFGAWLYIAEVAYGKVYGNGSENIHSPALRHVVDEHLADVLTTDPLSWFDVERQSVITMIHQAARDRQSEVCWGLACCTFSLFEMRRYFDDCRETLDAAFVVAKAVGDDLGHAAILYRLGTLSGNRNDDEQAIDQFGQAVAIFEKLGENHGNGLATLNIAMAYRRQGFNDLALDYFPKAVARLRDSGDKGAEAFALRNIGQAHLANGDYVVADGHFEQALELARRGKSRRREAQVLFYQGMLRLEQDRRRDAERLFLEVLALTRALGDRPGELQAQRGLALCYERNGDLTRAESMLIAALQLARQPEPTLFERKLREELERLAKKNVH